MVRLLLRRLERLVADDLAQLLRLHRRRVDGEVEIHLGAHVLLDVDGDVERRAVARHADVLRTDAERDAAADVDLLRHGQLVRAEAGDEGTVALDEVGLDEVHRGRADEAGDEEVRRRVVEHLRLVDLLQVPVAQHADAVAERHRLALVVGHVDRRHAEVALDAGDLGPHLHAQLRVEVGERLVHQERLRLAHDRASHRDPLALPARQMPRPLLQHLGEPEDPRGALDAPADLLLRDAAHLQAEAHVVVDVHVRVERVVLEDHRHVARLRRQVVHDLAADADDAAADLLEPGDHAERARLAAAGRSDEDDELAVGDVEVELVHGARAVRVDLRQALELDRRHGAGTIDAGSHDLQRGPMFP
ncbi:MAG TPA: hypothetical protein VNR59_07600 [Gaiellaceae bacterium]|nr:hypothetical protein [Gaiellaceae bacterium]